MKRRGAAIKRNCDLDSPYKCVVKGDGKLGTMDEYLHFFDCYAPLIMRDIIIGESEEFTRIVA